MVPAMVAEWWEHAYPYGYQYSMYSGAGDWPSRPKLITSNRSVGEWGTVFGDTKMITALLYRLLHHNHIITIRGDRYRLR